MTSLKGNIENYKKLGLIPSMTRGKQRWRVTYKTGKQDILYSPTIIKKLVIKGDIIKVEKKKVRVVLSDGSLGNLKEEDLTNWKDVTTWYKK